MMDIDFRYGKLSFGARLAAAGTLYAAGIGIQLLLKPAAIVGLVPIVMGWFVLAVKPTTNKPRDRGLEEWRPVSDAEITRIADNLKESKRLRRSLAGPTVLKVMALVALGIAALWAGDYSGTLSLVFFDLALFSVPGLFFGAIRVHVPAELDLKLSGFLRIMNAGRGTDRALTPYLRFDKDEEDRDIPEDMRFMLEPKRKPADLVGVQIQSSINDGENGKVPYMYAVVLTKGKQGPAYAAFSRMSANGYVVDPGGDDEYGTVVVRQETGGGGYHTTDDDCESLYGLMNKALDKVNAMA